MLYYIHDVFWVQAAVPDNPQEHSGHQESSRDPQWPGGHLWSHAGGPNQGRKGKGRWRCRGDFHNMFEMYRWDTFREHVTFNSSVLTVSTPTMASLNHRDHIILFPPLFNGGVSISIYPFRPNPPTSNITGWKAHVRDRNFIFHTELWLHYISVTEFQIVAPRDISHFALTQAALDEATEPWGIKVERVEM